MSGGGGGGDDAFAEEPEAHENHERYLLTYADMITLLMALFIILFAIGQTDIAKFKRFQTGLQKQFGAPALDGGTGVLNGSQLDMPVERVVALNYANPGLQDPSDIGTSYTRPGSLDKPVEITAYNADTTAKTITEVLEQAQLPPESFEVDVDTRGVVIRLATDDVTFASGSASLRPDSATSLDVVGRALTLVSNGIIVEGHTDNRPMGGTMTNWELSALRASSVLRYFETAFSIPQTRLQVAGYADTRPIASNDTEAGRARNRRVEIVIALPTAGTDVASHPTAVDPGLVDPAKPAPVNPLDIVVPKTTTTIAAGHK